MKILFKKRLLFSAFITALLAPLATHGNQEVQATRSLAEPTIAFVYGFITRYLASNVGSAFATTCMKNSTEILGQEDDTTSFIETNIATLPQVLGKFAVAIPLWVAAYKAYIKLSKMPLETTGDISNPSRKTLFDYFHSSGMDLYVTAKAFESVYTAWLADHTTPSLEQYREVITQRNNTELIERLDHFTSENKWSIEQKNRKKIAFLLGFIVGVVGFDVLGVRVANALYKDDKVMSTIIIFMVGLTSVFLLPIVPYLALEKLRQTTAIIGTWLGFSNLPASIPLESCYSCNAWYMAGSEIAYVISGVLPTLYAICKTGIFPKALPVCQFIDTVGATTRSATRLLNPKFKEH